MSRTMSVFTLVLGLLASATLASAQSNLHATHGGSTDDESLAAKVRDATSIYRDINRAIAAGYAQFGGCVSGPEVGAIYELHVWAWRDNPNGNYVDWNPRVSCDGGSPSE
jgi:hypothetical protein